MISTRILFIIANVVFGLVEGVLGLRIILKLFNASPIAPFVNWIYSISQPLLAPFVGMFPSPFLRRGGVLEFSSLFALLVYAIIGNLVEKMLFHLKEYNNRFII